ncbi:MAG TPA: hypothetical protein VK559_00205 [Ferruginibacter sp.]|nr:hypothetical protein [Ferruginibacter sp.]
MKKYRKTIAMVGVLFMLFTILPNLTVKAQGVGEGDPDSDVPFDGGLSLLVAAGIGYGIKKNKERKNNKDIEM